MTHGAWQRLRLDSYGVSGLVIVGVFDLIALCVWSGLLGQSWSEVSGGRWEGVSREHWLGTNMLGQDIMQRMLFGTATAFEVGLVVTICSTVLGTLLGAVAGWDRERPLDAGGLS